MVKLPTRKELDERKAKEREKVAQALVLFKQEHQFLIGAKVIDFYGEGYWFEGMKHPIEIEICSLDLEDNTGQKWRLKFRYSESGWHELEKIDDPS